MWSDVIRVRIGGRSFILFQIELFSWFGVNCIFILFIEYAPLLFAHVAQEIVFTKVHLMQPECCFYGIAASKSRRWRRFSNRDVVARNFSRHNPSSSSWRHACCAVCIVWRHRVRLRMFWWRHPKYVMEYRKSCTNCVRPRCFGPITVWITPLRSPGSITIEKIKIEFLGHFCWPHTPGLDVRPFVHNLFFHPIALKYKSMHTSDFLNRIFA